MAYGDMPMAGGMGGETEEESPPSSPTPESYASDEEAALAEAFPELAGKPERLSALRTAIQICVDNATSGGSGGRDSEPPPMKGKGGSAKAPNALILAFGGKPKGKSA